MSRPKRHRRLSSNSIRNLKPFQTGDMMMEIVNQDKPLSDKMLLFTGIFVLVMVTVIIIWKVVKIQIENRTAILDV